MNINGNHISYSPDGKSIFDSYILGDGCILAFNEIYQNTWPTFDKKDQRFNSLTINICINGRCDVSLGNGKYESLTKNHVAISIIPPDKNFFYPDSLYEGISLCFDLEKMCDEMKNYFELSGIDLNAFKNYFCNDSEIYHQETNEEIQKTVCKLWNIKNTGDTGKYRFYMLKLMYELLELSPKSASLYFYTKGQIAIIKKAESIAMSDLSVRYSAKEFSEMFGISESSFRQYFKGIFGQGYLEYFREQRMIKAAKLLETTNLSIADIALSVGYNNQGKFAKTFTDFKGVSPLEYRRLSKQ